jgi:hypothetical protein
MSSSYRRQGSEVVHWHYSTLCNPKLTTEGDLVSWQLGLLGDEIWASLDALSYQMELEDLRPIGTWVAPRTCPVPLWANAWKHEKMNILHLTLR